MKSVIVVGLVVGVVITITLILTNLTVSDVVEPQVFTDAATATAQAPTATPTSSAFGSVTPVAPRPTSTSSRLPTRQPGVIPESTTFHPPFSYSLDIGQSGRYVLADGSSRTVRLVGTDLVFAYNGLTVWATATVEVSGNGLEPVTKEIAAAYFQKPTVIHDVRIWVDITDDFNDGRLRDGGATENDARLLLSDARLPMSDASKFFYPYPTLVWQEGSDNTYHQALQGSLDTLFHHGAIDLGMPENTPVHAWSTGMFEATDRGFDWQVRISNAEGGLPRDIIVLHLTTTEEQKDDTRVPAGELLGYSGQANWFHTHLAYGFELIHLLAEWYEHDASPERLSYVKDWLAAGPYINDEDALRLTEDYLNGEAQVQPELGDSAPDGREWLYWDNMVPGVIMVAETVNPFPMSGWASVNENEPDGAIYMATYVESPEAQQVVLNVGASDAVKVWVGDTVVLEEDRCIPGPLGEGRGRLSTIHVDEFKVPVDLEAGWNRVLVKTAQRDGCPESFQLSMRFSDAAGMVVPGLTVDPLRGATPPEPQPLPAESELRNASGPIALSSNSREDGADSQDLAGG